MTATRCSHTDGLLAADCALLTRLAAAQEPLSIYLLGVSHFSDASAEQVRCKELQHSHAIECKQSRCRSGRSSPLCSPRMWWSSCAAAGLRCSRSSKIARRAPLLAAPTRLHSGTSWAATLSPNQHFAHALSCRCSGSSLAQSLMRSVQLGGGEQLLVRGLLAAQADRVARELGTQSQGAETRAASSAAAACGATIVLGETSTHCPQLPSVKIAYALLCATDLHTSGDQHRQLVVWSSTLHHPRSDAALLQGIGQ